MFDRENEYKLESMMYFVADISVAVVSSDMIVIVLLMLDEGVLRINTVFLT